jgi:hypothetical protein
VSDTGTYILWVNEDRTVLARWWPKRSADDPDDSVEVATRPDPHAIWGPPVELKMEVQR